LFNHNLFWGVGGGGVQGVYYTYLFGFSDWDYFYAKGVSRKWIIKKWNDIFISLSAACSCNFSWSVFEEKVS